MAGLLLWGRRLWVLLQVAWHVAVGKVQKILFPERMKRNLLSQSININQNPAFEYKDWGPTFFSIQYFFFVLKVRWQHLEDQALQWGLAPNSPVVTLNGESRRIWDFMNDGWAFANNIEIRHHRTLHERMEASRRLRDKKPMCPVVLDTMDNLTSRSYAALPERFYVLLEGRILFKGGPGPWRYNPEEVRKVLEKLSR